MSAPVPRMRNPYVGPRAFRKDELFFGREAETEGLLDKLLPSGVLLLHAPSGAGKTSLIQAAIVPELLNQGFQICASATSRFSALRVNLPHPRTSTSPTATCSASSTASSVGSSTAPMHRG